MSYGIWRIRRKSDGSIVEERVITSDTKDCFIPRTWETEEEAISLVAVWRITAPNGTVYQVRRID